jgi:DNA-binding MarR family transcriptional regulator
MRPDETGLNKNAARKRVAKPAHPNGSAPVTFEDNVGVRIVRLAEVFTRLAKIGVEDPWGLRGTDLRILNILDGVDCVPISEIARRTHVDKAWISRSVRQLIDKGLVERRVDPSDSRVSLAVLTPLGRALLDKIRPSVLSSERRVLDGIEEHAFKLDLDQLLANAEAILEAAEAARRCR